MTERLPHGYTNATSRTATTVTKRYLGPDAELRLTREVAALRGLADALPVPAVTAVHTDAIVLERMPGRPGQEVLLKRPGPVLHTVGVLARRLQQLPPDQVPGLAGSGVLVHGDFGPQNLLLDPTTAQVTAVLDWELVRLGSPVDDLAWTEWIVRTHHPDLVGQLPALFAGYGAQPPWPARRAAMLRNCAWALDFVTRWSGRDSPAAELWRRRTALTAEFESEPWGSTSGR